ncbi:MAG: feruloyl-CoA synthase [Methylobacteriaceae bacterium]|nr:feruloyl-CoA synthase [Methylobacteriaceae bacterium]
MAGKERPVRLGHPDVSVERRADGTILVESIYGFGPVETCMTDYLVRHAREAPDRVFIAKRGADGEWVRLTYAETLRRVERIAAGLLSRDLSAERPIAILSGNDIEHLLLALAAMHVGIPFAPISVAYSTVSKDFSKLRFILDLLTPGLIFAADGARFAAAIEACVPDDVEVVTTIPTNVVHATPFAELERTPGPDVAAAHEAVTHDTIAKFLFTSGSTGSPKGVINTQRMICSNVAQIRAAMPVYADEPPIFVDWLPWNHTFGGNHDVHVTLAHGGTFYIDDGKPLPGAFSETIRNLKEIAPTCYLNVPKGFEMLVHELDRDEELAKNFFSRVKFLKYAGASLPQHVWDGLERIALKTCGETIRMITGLGATETAPSAMFTLKGDVKAGMVGTPVPGCQLKLVPNGDKLEVRMRGPNITPGYWREPSLTAAAFDDEGFYMLGDALRWVDEAQPERGFIFDGRITEDFKLVTGTWVSVGSLRTKMIAHFAPLMRDAVITGHDRDDLGAILILDPEGCRARFSDIAAGSTPADLARHAGLRAELAERLASFARSATGSSTRLARIAILEEAPSMDKGEITDKGSINQRAMLAHRKHLVEALYNERGDARVIALEAVS